MNMGVNTILAIKPKTKMDKDQLVNQFKKYMARDDKRVEVIDWMGRSEKAYYFDARHIATTAKGTTSLWLQLCFNPNEYESIGELGDYVIQFVTDSCFVNQCFQHVALWAKDDFDIFYLNNDFESRTFLKIEPDQIDAMLKC